MGVKGVSQKVMIAIQNMKSICNKHALLDGNDKNKVIPRARLLKEQILHHDIISQRPQMLQFCDLKNAAMALHWHSFHEMSSEANINA